MEFTFIFSGFLHQLDCYFIKGNQICCIVNSSVSSFTNFIVQFISITKYSWNLSLNVDVLCVLVSVFTLIGGVLCVSTRRLGIWIHFLFIILLKLIKSWAQSTISFCYRWINHRFLSLIIGIESFELLLHLWFFHRAWLLHRL